jgi:hypothetical protein
MQYLQKKEKIFMKSVIEAKKFSKTVNELIVRSALGMVGVGEKFGNNDGPEVREMLLEVRVVSPEPWCAAAVWTWVRMGVFAAFRANIREGVAWSSDLLTFQLKSLLKINTPSSRAMFKAMKDLGWTRPYQDGFLPGDLLFISRAGAAWQGHVAILNEERDVYSVLKQPTVKTIEANIGDFPSYVQAMHRDLSKEDVIGVGRIFGFID